MVQVLEFERKKKFHITFHASLMYIMYIMYMLTRLLYLPSFFLNLVLLEYTKNILYDKDYLFILSSMPWKQPSNSVSYAFFFLKF